MKKTFILSLCCLMTALQISGCSGTPKPQAEGSDSAPSQSSGESTDVPKDLVHVKVGVMPYMQGAVINYAKSQKLDEQFGLDIEMVNFSIGGMMIEGLAANEWDFAAIGMAGVYGMANYNAKWIAEFMDDTPGLVAFVRPDSAIARVKGFNPTYPNIYGDPESLKGAKILISTGSSMHYTALKYIEKLGMTEEDVDLVNIDTSQAFQAFVAGEGDVFCSPPAYIEQCFDQGWIPAAPYKELCSDEIYINNGILVSDSFLNKDPETVQKFIDMVMVVVDRFSKDDQLIIQEVSQWYQVNGKEVSEESVAAELEISPFPEVSVLDNPDYTYGQFMFEIADFYANLGQIESDKLESTRANVVDTYWRNAYQSLKAEKLP